MYLHVCSDWLRKLAPNHRCAQNQGTSYALHCSNTEATNRTTQKGAEDRVWIAWEIQPSTWTSHGSIQVHACKVSWTLNKVFTSTLFLQVFRLAYCHSFHPSDYHHVKTACQEFLTAIQHYKPQFLQKPKIHLLLHLPDSMMQFGPTALFNTER